MNKRIVIVTIFLVILVVAAGFMLFSQPILSDIIDGYKKPKRNPEMMTNEEIRDKFHCKRKTKDTRPTDIYCGTPNLYRQHARQDKIIPSL